MNDHSNVIHLARARELARSGEGKRIRESARLTVGDIGRACGVDQSTIYRWEHGLRAPRGPAAVRYAELLTLLARGQGSGAVAS